MKYKLLSVEGIKSINIGDYIQALASSQFLPSVDGFVNREELKDYDGEECIVIMNGWYMHNPKMWPPSEKIHPIFLSFHINSLASNEMLSEESLNYLKKHEPIGCRDYYTCELLKSYNIEAFFSGCMTLTLGLNYHQEIRDDKYYFVDPFYQYKNSLKNLSLSIIELLIHYKSIHHISKKLPNNKKGVKSIIKTAFFFKEYKRFFSKDILTRAEYVCQESSDYHKFGNNYELLREAERLVKCYSKAKLVVTSRIHCALPCLGLDTPVVFIENLRQKETSRCRLNGLRELFNLLVWDEQLRHTQSFNPTTLIDAHHIPQNKLDCKKISANLIQKCQMLFAK